MKYLIIGLTTCLIMFSSCNDDTDKSEGTMTKEQADSTANARMKEYQDQQAKQIQQPIYRAMKNYIFAVLTVHKSSYSGTEILTYTTEIVEVDHSLSEEEKYRLMDEMQKEFNKSPEHRIAKAVVKDRNVYEFDSYVGASKAREKFTTSK